MGPSMQAYSVHARKLEFSSQIICSERSGMFSWFHRYFDLSDLTHFGWDMSLCTQAQSVHAQVVLCAQKGLVCSPDSIDTLISWIPSKLAEIWACAQKHIGCMHATLHAWGEVCAQRGLAWPPDSIYTLISLIHSNLAEIWACARKHIVWMNACLHAQVILCAQRGRAWSLDSIDTVISLIGLNWAESTIQIS